MPEMTRDEIIVDRFWIVEFRVGYEQALKIVADEYKMTCAEVERVLIEDDALNDGNC